MAVHETYLSFLVDQLSNFGPFETKKMFGGVGFFRDGLMFAMLGGDTFRLKVDAENQAAFVARGMQPYHSTKKGKGMPYWAVPQDIIEDREELTKWATQAFAAAQRAKK